MKHIIEKYIKVPISKLLALTIKEFLIILVVICVIFTIGYNIIFDFDNEYFGNSIKSFFYHSYYFRKIFKVFEFIAGFVSALILFYFIFLIIKDRIVKSGGFKNFIFEVLSLIFMIVVIIFSAFKWGVIGFICALILAPFIYLKILGVIDSYKYSKERKKRIQTSYK